MPNLRIIHNNAADRATLTASSSVGALVPTNLKSDLKSVVWRSATAGAGTTPTARLDASWPATEPIGGVALAYCRLTAQALMRVRGTNEAPATNLLTAPNDFTNAAWTRSNMTAATGVAGPDGANSATTLTATAGAAEIRQARTVAAGASTSSIFIRRRTGSGAVSIRNAANTAWLPLDLTSAWTRVANDGGTTGTSALLGIQIATAGNAIDVCYAQLEAGPVVTSYYPGARPLGYMDAWQPYDLDSGWINPCPASEVTPATMGANGYAYGEGTHARAWLAAPAAVRFLRIEISDPGNPGGYIEAARLVCGNYWEPEFNPDYGASVQPVDSSTNFRNGAGDLMSDVGTRNDKLSLSMSWLKPGDRAALLRILRGNGITRPSFVSLFPNHSDPLLEQDHQVFGKLVETPAMSLPSYNIAAATLQIESV